MKGILIGTLLTGFAIAMAIFFYVSNREPRQALAVATMLAPGTVKGVSTGDPVAVEARIPADAELLDGTIVLGVSERASSSDEWRVDEVYNQPLTFSLEDGTLVNAVFPSAAPNGAHHTEELGGSVRKRGYQRGDPLFMLGTVTSMKPLELNITQHFGGTITDYRATLDSNVVYGITGAFGLTGILILVSSIRKRRRPPPPLTRVGEISASAP